MKRALGIFVGGRLQYYFQCICFWGPDAKMRFVFADNLRAYRITPLIIGLFHGSSSSSVLALVCNSGFSTFTQTLRSWFMSVTTPVATNPSQSRKVVLVNHPLVATKLSVLRAKTTAPEEFRRNLNEISLLLAVEAARSGHTERIEVETPLTSCAGARLANRSRSFRSCAPVSECRKQSFNSCRRPVWATSACIGKRKAAAGELLLPPSRDIDREHVLLLDPMLATGFSACEAVTVLKKHGASRIQFLCIIGCNADVERLHRDHPEVEIITAAIDPILNDHGYIVPGLGDAGDRYFGTE